MHPVLKQLTLAAAVLTVTACGSPGPTEARLLLEAPLDPAATYLRTVRDTPAPPEAIALATLGVTPGDAIRIQAVGAWTNGRGDRYSGAAALFSTDERVLAPDSLHRVPGALALAVAPAYRSWDTYHGGESTDVPEDFPVSGEGVDSLGITVTVPQGARYLFFTVRDHLFADNRPAPEGWSVRISRVAASPSG